MQSDDRAGVADLPLGISSGCFHTKNGCKSEEKPDETCQILKAPSMKGKGGGRSSVSPNGKWNRSETRLDEKDETIGLELAA